MHPEQSRTTATAAARTASRQDSRALLARRRAAMPVIAASRVSLDVVRRRWPVRGGWMFAWLRFIRPVVFVMLWLLLVRYVWKHFFGLPDELPLWQLIALYAVAVGVIVLVMLALAPMRRREQREEPAGEAQPSSLGEMSGFSGFAPSELGELQQAQRVVIHHDSDGLPDRAEDTGKLLAARATDAR